MPIDIYNKIYKFRWRESQTINSGSNSFTLTNTIPENGVLKIVDTKYGAEWSTPAHYTVSNQTVTLTESALSETLTFIIDCFV